MGARPVEKKKEEEKSEFAHLLDSIWGLVKSAPATAGGFTPERLKQYEEKPTVAVPEKTKARIARTGRIPPTETVFGALGHTLDREAIVAAGELGTNLENASTGRKPLKLSAWAAV